MEMKRPVVLVVDKFPASTQAEFAALPIDFRYQPDWKRPEILAAMPEVDALVMNSKTQVDRALLAQSPRLRLLCRAGVGMDHFDLPALAERGIRVVNAPGANATPVGEQAVGMLLSLLHRIPWADREVRQLEWQREPNRGTELAGKTVGVIGHGATGSAFTRCISGFGCRILAYDKYKPSWGNAHVTEATVEQIQAEADILSLHIPLTAETDGMVTARWLADFQCPIYLLNLARGPIVPMAELVTALEERSVIAAGLDVLENEKLGTLTAAQRTALDALIATDRVIFTPHIGGWSHESLARINAIMVDAVRKFAAG